MMADSPVRGIYDDAIDRESAYELLEEREADAAEAAEKAAAEEAKAKEQAAKKKTRRRSTRQTPTEAAIKQTMRTASREITKYVLRGIFGGRRR